MKKEIWSKDIKNFLFKKILLDIAADNYLRATIFQWCLTMFIQVIITEIIIIHIHNIIIKCTN